MKNAQLSFRLVNPCIFKGIFDCCLLNVHGIDRLSPEPGGEYGENAGTAAKIEHLAILKRQVFHQPDHHEGGFMVSCAKGHFGLYDQFVPDVRKRRVEGGPDPAEFTNCYRTEITFPDFVPVPGRK